MKNPTDKPLKKVLIFTYYWPPGGGPGVQRFLKFTKFLPEFGWKPYVVTVKKGSYPYIDKSLINDIHPEVVEVKTKTLDPFGLYNLLQGKKGKEVPVAMMGIKDSKSPFQKLAKYIRANYFIPDARKYWKSYALKAAEKLIKNNKFDAIITTSPPHSTHLIGLELKERHNIPWLADLRDPWTNIYYNKFLPRTRKTEKKDKALEDTVIKTADCVSVVSPGLKNEFQDRARHIELLFNGFDEKDFEEVSSLEANEFTLHYIGNYKPNQNVPALWHAIMELIEEDNEIKADLKLKFTGKLDPVILKEMEQTSLKQILQVDPFVEHKEATRLMCSANMLLFVIPIAKDNDLILTGKIFEYLASKSPMLSIGPVNGNAAHIINECSRNKMIDYGDKASIKAAIREEFSYWQRERRLQKHNDEGYLKFGRRSITKDLSDVLNNLDSGVQ